MKVKIIEVEATPEDLEASNTVGDNINKFLNSIFGCFGKVEKKEKEDDNDSDN